MSRPPLISISLPTRNRLALIQRTIARVLAQTFTDWELVICDNASDEPGKIAYLKELAAGDPRIKVHVHPVNIGIHANWVFGIQQCAGRYYIALTDDDWWAEPDFLAQLLTLHDGTAGVVFPNLSIEFPQGGEPRVKVLTGVYDNTLSRPELCDRMVRDRQGIIMMGLFDLHIVSKDELVSVYDHGRHNHCETVGMVRIARDHSSKFCPSVTYVHTSYEDNYSLRLPSELTTRDAGIGTFLLLEELRLAAAKDPGYEAAMNSQWRLAVAYCHEVAARYHVKNHEVVAGSKKKKGPLRAFISKRRKALKAWVKRRFRRS